MDYKRIYLIIISIIVFNLVLTGCQNDEIPPPTSPDEQTPIVGFLEGMTWDEYGNPCADSIVSVSKTAYALSESNGEYTLAGVIGPLDVTFSRRDLVSLTVAGLNTNSWGHRFAIDHTVEGTWGSISGKLVLPDKVLHTGGLDFELRSSRSNYIYVHIPQGTSSADFFMDYVIPGPITLFVREVRDDFTNQYFALKQGLLVEGGKDTSSDVEIFDLSFNPAYEIKNLPVSIPYMPQGIENLYFYSWSPISDGHVLPAQDITFTQASQFDYPVITSPYWDVYNLNIWAENDKGWLSAWKTDVEIGSPTIIFDIIIPKIPDVNVSFEGAGGLKFTWDAVEGITYSEIYINRKISDTKYEWIWKGVTMNNYIYYPELPDIVDWGIKLESGQTYSYSISFHQIPGYDMNINNDTSTHSASTGIHTKEFVMP